MRLIQSTSMALTLLCVVMLIDAQTQQHKLILLLQTESKREREKKRQLFGKYIALYNEHLEIPSRRAARREGGKNLPALIVCVGLGGLHDRQGFLCPGHYSIKEEPGLEDWPQHCRYRRSQGTHLSSVSNTPETSWGQTQCKSLTPHTHHYQDRRTCTIFSSQIKTFFKKVVCLGSKQEDTG